MSVDANKETEKFVIDVVVVKVEGEEQRETRWMSLTSGIIRTNLVESINVSPGKMVDRCPPSPEDKLDEGRNE